MKKADEDNPVVEYVVPEGVACIVTEVGDMSNRREHVTRKRCTFKAPIRESQHSLQFEANGWYLVVPRYEVFHSRERSK